MLNKIKETLLNTPEKYWLIVGNYHIHKSFWGIMFVILGVILMFNYNSWTSTIALTVGLFILTISVIGQKYTHGKYKLEIMERYDRKNSINNENYICKKF